MTTKIQIKHRFTYAVLYECDAPYELPSGLHARHALGCATKDRANLDGANLDGANLAGANLAVANLAVANLAGANLDGANLDGANLAVANLAGANLAGANLAGASLDRANLDGANLDGANLDGANLDGANLVGAKLAGAKLAGAKLIGDRPFFQIGPIGSRHSYFVAYLTDQGIKLRAGCFFGTVDEFREKLAEKHGTNDHAKEYEAALTLIQAHADLWTPAVSKAPE